jgi:hypothetical protein
MQYRMQRAFRSFVMRRPFWPGLFANSIAALQSEPPIQLRLHLAVSYVGLARSLNHFVDERYLRI